MVVPGIGIAMSDDSRYLNCDEEDVSEQFDVGAGKSANKSLGIICRSLAFKEFPKFKDDSVVETSWMDSVFKL